MGESHDATQSFASTRKAVPTSRTYSTCGIPSVTTVTAPPSGPWGMRGEDLLSPRAPGCGCSATIGCTSRERQRRTWCCAQPKTLTQPSGSCGRWGGRAQRRRRNRPPAQTARHPEAGRSDHRRGRRNHPPYHRGPPVQAHHAAGMDPKIRLRLVPGGAPLQPVLGCPGRVLASWKRSPRPATARSARRSSCERSTLRG